MVVLDGKRTRTPGGGGRNRDAPLGPWQLAPPSPDPNDVVGELVCYTYLGGTSDKLPGA